jgi:drug/metabolite transporter (DMT)-like permease
MVAGGKEDPIARGALVAVAAALLFGLATPIVRRAGEGVGPFATAALLYAGAAIGSGLPTRRADEPAPGRAQAPRILAVAVLGAMLAPACLAWGLQRSGALAGALLLNLEAVLTVGLAWVVFREPIGRRVALAAALMVAGGVLLTTRAAEGGASTITGLVAIAGATLAWALDNTLTRPLADFDPRAVVFWKGALGAAQSVVVSLAMRETWPKLGALAALLVCGAAGYGVSLRLYLHAQRVLGAARTGSIFAVAPFVGAVVAFLVGDRADLVRVGGSAVLFGAAVWLHVSEKHAHAHRHAAAAHEHAHRHDDGHHAHPHEPPVLGTHSHAHVHEPVEHEHPHGADLHHAHEHVANPHDAEGSS